MAKGCVANFQPATSGTRKASSYTRGHDRQAAGSEYFKSRDSLQGATILALVEVASEHD